MVRLPARGTALTCTRPHRPPTMGSGATVALRRGRRTDVVIDESTIREAVQLLLRAAPGSKVILFGSHARGRAGPDSDLDFLVVEPRLSSRREEAVRLRDVLRPIRIPADVLVVSEETFRRWSDTPGTVLYEAAHGGRVFDAVT